MGITYPTTDGTSGQVLQTNGAGALTFVSVAAGGATDIDGLSDAITNSSGRTIGLGTGALANDDGTTNDNTALGYNALNGVTSGQHNTGIGYGAGGFMTTGADNTLVGYFSGFNITDGLRNTLIGYESGYSISTADDIVAVGYNAGRNSGAGSVWIGSGSGDAGTGGTSSSVGIGKNSLTKATSYGNTAVGANAGEEITTGQNNTLIGRDAGAFSTYLTTGTNNTIIGFNAFPSSSAVSNEITLGNTSIATLRCNQTTISSLSDRRDKTDIEDLPIGLDFIKSLRPVKFRWDRRDGTMSNVKDAGFIAQELDEVQQDFNSEEYMKMVLKTNPEKLEAAPGKLIPVLVKAIQELSQEVERLKEGK